MCTPALAIEIIVAVAQTVDLMWKGPLGDVIRELFNKHRL